MNSTFREAYLFFYFFTYSLYFFEKPPSMSFMQRHNSTPIYSPVPEETHSTIVMSYSDTDLKKKETSDTPENSP